MDFGPDNIDWIVKEVVRRLNATGGQEPPASRIGARVDTAAGQADGQLKLAARVISLADVRDKLAGVKAVEVSRGAVITPAVRDLLREQNIALQVSPNGREKSSIRTAKLVVGLAEAGFDPGSLLSGIKDMGIQFEQLARTGLATVAGELADRVGRGGESGLLLTGETAAALCLANRHRGVRAAAAGDGAEAATALESVGANLLILDPRGKSSFQLRRAVQTFWLAETHACPEWLRGYLD